MYDFELIIEARNRVWADAELLRSQLKNFCEAHDIDGANVEGLSITDLVKLASYYERIRK